MPPTVTDGPLERDVERTLLVQQMTWEAEGVLSIRFVHPQGEQLSGWSPGAHLDLKLPSGLIRHYSLCGDPDDRSTYTISVLRDDNGRGGSREIHDTPLLGRIITAKGPRNHFELVDAPRYLFLAGGIGITPILTMVRDVSRRGVPWRLVYGGRTRSSMAFLRELKALGGENVDIVPQDEHGILDLKSILTHTTGDTAVYCCGPEGMIRAAEQHCRELLPEGALHVERFSTPTGATAASKPPVAGRGIFEVELRRTGGVLTVQPDRTLLEVILEVLPGMMYDCREGFCGSCVARVLEGVPEHHDTILTPTESEKGDTMMTCVGRSKSARLVLDL